MLYFIQINLNKNNLNKNNLNKIVLNKKCKEGKTDFRMEGQYVYWKKKGINSITGTL